ncbi:MAG TPA: hypothetical protein VG186_01275 [Solirubrobacteraceae bacterium]|jgi:hypothetical protein|nr:hypothetical protein [Solirubrobacteraceae bacterium]
MRKRILAATTVVVAAAIAIATTAAATTSKATETFSMITSSVPTGSVIATGTFTGGGTFTAKGRFQKVRFPNGTFELVQQNKPHKNGHLNAATCLYTQTGTGTYALANGTGAYKGISGSGKDSYVLRQVLARVKGVCAAPNTNVVALQFIETARGPASLT